MKPKNQHRNPQQITVRIPLAMRHKLDAVAAKNSLKPSVVARMALAQFLDQINGKPITLAR